MKSTFLRHSGSAKVGQASSLFKHAMKAGIVAAGFMAMGVGGAGASASEDGSEIYDAILNKYKSIATYSDTGVMSNRLGHGEIDTIRFSTKYKKPDEFRIEFVTPLPYLFKNYVVTDVLYGNGQEACLTENNVVVDKYSSIKQGINATMGISRRITSTIPSLFLGRGVGAGIHCFPESPRRLDDEEVLGKKCYHLQVKDYGGGIVDIWASKDDLLVRRVKMGKVDILLESVAVGADAEWDVSASNATPKIRFVKVEGKSYSFSIPDNVKFNLQDDPEGYTFFLPSEIITPFVILPNPGVKGTNSIPKIVKKIKAGFMEEMKVQDKKVISVTEKSCNYGLFVGGEMKFTVQMDPDSFTDQYDQYILQLWDGTRGWLAVLVSSNTNDIKLARKILESGKPTE